MIQTPRNPKYGKWEKPEGYTDLGWQVHAGNNDALAKCKELGHMNIIKSYDNSLYQNRGTHYIYTCDICKHYWHIDMSD
jgi:hypothetical protein